MSRGENFHCMFRTSYKRYTKRPPSNCPSARTAWDTHADMGAKRGHGNIVWMRLLDGYWGALFEDGEILEVENVR